MQNQSSRFEALEARAATRLRVLQCIRESEAISRSDIAARLESSPATITAACSALLDAGLVEEAPPLPADGARLGRPRVLLRIKSDAMLVGGLKVSRDDIQVLIADFAGNEIGTFASPLGAGEMAVQDLIRKIAKTFHDACAALGIASGDVAALGVGLPGFINGATGFVHWSSSFTERNVDLKPLMEDHLPCPVFLDNDANLVAKAEQLFGAAKGCDNFLVVTLEHGVGMGIVLDGGLYRGDRGCGAEFGHMKVQLDGAMCQCGQHGCLEAYVGEYALVREAFIGRPDGVARTLQDVLDEAALGEGPAYEVLDRASRILGTALASLINLFDPEHIVIARSRPQFDARHTEAMMKALSQNTIRIDAPLPKVTVRNLDQSMWAKGAAAHGIEMVSVLKVQQIGTKDAA